VPSLARDEALLRAFDLVALALPVLALRTGRDRLAALGVIVAGLSAMALAMAVEIHGSGAVTDVYRFSRLSFPIAYANSQAALFMLGFWPAVVLAGRNAGGFAGRTLSFGAASLLFAAALLGQSKGAAIGFVVSLLAVTAVSPARLRILLVTLLAVAPTAVAIVPLTRPYEFEDPARLAPAVDDAALAVVACGLAGLVLGSLFAFVDGRVDLAPRTRRLAGRLVLGATVAGALAGAVAFVAIAGSPTAWASEKWKTFKQSPAHETASTHLLSLGSNRYDFWRVAVDEWKDHPLVGEGARGFQVAYLRSGRSRETPARAHSLPLELLGEEGLVGAASFLGAIGVALFVLTRRTRRRQATAAAALAASAGWTAHAAVDWISTFPAVSVPFFLLVAVGLSKSQRVELGPRLAPATGIAAVILAAVVFTPPWLSARLVDRGTADRNRNELAWAHRFDPVSVSPLVAEAEIAATPDEAIPPLEDARRRQPRSVAVRYLLGSAYYNAGRFAASVRELEAAHALYPRHKGIERSLALARSRL
jgi:O-antigen ligase